MSTVKITELEEIVELNSNTANTIMVAVDLPTGVTGKVTALTLANGLYKYNRLNVGDNEDFYPNTVAQFAGSSNNYIQVNLENIMNDYGTADYIVGANTGSDTSLYIDLGFANKLFNNVYSYNGLSTSLYPLDGYLYVQGDVAGEPGGNLVIGTASTNREIRFIAGGVNTENVVVRISSTGLGLRNNANLSFTDGSIQTTAASPLAYSAAAYESANNNAVSISAANTFLQSYTDTANTKLKAYSDAKFLANTTGILQGNLTINGSANVNLGLVISNTTYDYANTSLVKILGSTPAVVQPANPGYMLEIAGVDGVSSRVINTAYGTNAYGLFAARKARGTAESPTAIANNDVIARFSGGGYNGSAFTPTGQGRIDIVADEDFTTANNGSRIEFYNTINKTNTVTKIATFNANTALFTGAIYPNKGFIYTPRVVSGNSTTAVIDFSTDSMVKLTCNADCTLSFTNYTAGKIVEVWITNISGAQHVITHGCSALNATNNATTKNLPASSSMNLQYFSIDGDLANTFVSVTQG